MNDVRSIELIFILLTFPVDGMPTEQRNRQEAGASFPKSRDLPVIAHE